MKIRNMLAVGIVAAVPASMAMGDVIFYDNQGAFEDAMAAAGKSLKFVETFEENNAADGGVFTLDPVLTGGVRNVDPDGFGFENGLDATNLTVSTTDGKLPLVLLTEGFISNTSDVVGPNTFADNGVLSFDSGDKTGVGLDLWVLANNSGSMQVDVFDVAGNMIGSSVISTGGDLTYLGVQSTGAAIGAIITTGTVGNEGELFDNVAMYTIPAPGALALLGLAGLTRRRRRS